MDGFLFGDFELDDDGRELRRRSRPVVAPRKALAFLRALVRRAPAVVTRAELVAEVWEGRAVSASAMNTVAKLARRAIGDEGQRVVRTVHGIGYAFVAPVERRGAVGVSPAREARRDGFVGREEPFARLVRLVDGLQTGRGARIAWVHGRGGIGKTTLVQRVESAAVERGVTWFTVPCVHVRASPDALLHAVADALASAPRGVLVLDGYESLASLDDWVRERFLATLPDGWRLVLAGRRGPDARWLADPAFHGAEDILVEELSAAEASELLARRGVAPDDRPAIVASAGGHPLTLVLAAEAKRSSAAARAPASGSDALFRSLLDALAREAPSMRHAEALECLAVADVMDEPLLAAMLGDGADARACFDWLRELGMVGAGADGLVLHELAKQAIVTDLGWRNRERLGALAQRAFDQRLAELERASTVARRRRLVLSIWRLKALHPAFAPMISLTERSAVPRASEVDSIARRIAHFEGAASGDRFRRHHAHGRLAVRVLRGAADALAGYSVLLDLRADDAEARAIDPAVRALDAFADAGREPYAVLRWFADHDRFHALTPVSIACHMMNAEEHIARLSGAPGLSFALVSNPDEWSTMVRFSGFERMTPDVVMDGRTFAVFGRDWRRQSVSAWLRGLSATVASRLATSEPVELGLPTPAAL